MAVLVESLTRTYGTGLSSVRALDNVSLSFPVGSFTAVMGPSGSGKSTLLQCAAGLDRPDSGRVSIGGTKLSGLSETALTRLRRDRVGFVFQSFNLMPALTAAQNVELPLRLAGRKADPKTARTARQAPGHPEGLTWPSRSARAAIRPDSCRIQVAAQAARRRWQYSSNR